MQEQGVEESDSPGYLIGENHTALRDTKNRMIRREVEDKSVVGQCVVQAYQAQGGLIPGAEAQVATLALLLAESNED